MYFITKHLIVIVLSGICFSCVTNKSIYGIYVSSDVNYFNISIQENNIFYYTSKQGLISPISEGKWIKNNDTLVLNSFQKYKTDYIELVKQKVVNSASNIKIIDYQGSPIINNPVFLNNDFENKFETNTDGWVDCKEKIKTVHVVTLNGYYKVELNSINFYEIIIKVVPENMNHTYFENKKFILDRNKLLEIKEDRIYKKE